MDRAQNIRRAFQALGERVNRALRTQRGDLVRIRAHMNEVDIFRRQVEVVRQSIVPFHEQILTSMVDACTIR
jgi:hypothetical protein